MFRALVLLCLRTDRTFFAMVKHSQAVVTPDVRSSMTAVHVHSMPYCLHDSLHNRQYAGMRTWLGPVIISLLYLPHRPVWLLQALLVILNCHSVDCGLQSPTGRVGATNR
jgi:hypothetical protein